MNIFQEMFYSIAGVKHYSEFLQNKKGKVVLYVTVLVFICFAIAHLKTIPATMDIVSEVQTAVMNFPDFELKSGTLQMEEPFYYEEDDILIMMDSDNGSYIKEFPLSSWKETLSYYNSVFVMDETTILIKNNGETDIYDYPADFHISRDWVYGKIDYIYVIITVYLILAYLFSLIGYFLTALLVALVGMIACSFMNQKLTFGQIYLLSLYAKTLAIFIKKLLRLINYSFFGLSILMFALSCLYLGIAIHHMDMRDAENRKIDTPIIF